MSGCTNCAQCCVCGNDSEEDAATIAKLREALEEATSRIDKLCRLLLEHEGADPNVVIIEADYAEARNVYLRELLA